MEDIEFFPYTWHYDETNEDITAIRIYGLNSDNETVCAKVNDFTPYCYIELPIQYGWTENKAQLFSNQIDTIMGDKKPLKKVFMKKYKLYGAYYDEDGNRKLFPYLFCSFSNKIDRDKLRYKLKFGISIPSIGKIDNIRMHEYKADPILQLLCCSKISTTGWIHFQGKPQLGDNKETYAKHEYVVRWKSLKDNSENVTLPKPLVMSFDIEVNSTNPSAMPSVNNPGDKVFQISCILSRVGDKAESYKKILISLGDPEQSNVGTDVKLILCKTEASLLQEFIDLIKMENPNILAGFNILGFDMEYLIGRAKLNLVTEFNKIGFHMYTAGSEKIIKWSSSAFKTQEFKYIDAEGRVYIDLLPLVQRDFKLSNYKLKTISTHFLGETKDPLSAKGIFKCYRLGITKNSEGKYDSMARKAMGVVGKYCIQDSVLVLKLMEYLQTWVGLTEMAKTCMVPIFALYTQGQQNKVFSQIYKYCTNNNIVVEHDVYEVAETDRYMGAHVFDPIVGQHQRVVPFDFKSLYPTTIISENIDYSTWVPDDVTNIPDDMCNVMEWEDHVCCCHDSKVIRVTELSKIIEKTELEIKKLRLLRDSRKGKTYTAERLEITEKINQELESIKPYKTERSELKKSIIGKKIMCAKRKFRFLKEPLGVIPTVIQNLLDAREHTRKVDMKSYKKRLETEKDPAEIENIKSILSVLDKRQLAYKVSANSMYGAMGVRKGAAPFMAGAMCTTFIGRKNIEIVSKVIPEKYGGVLVYGDTDSNYVKFPNIKTIQETWTYAEYVAKEVTKLFKKPIQLEFEEAIYEFFFILTKKRYMYRESNKYGEISTKIGNKGVLLARRDNSKFVRDVYEGVMKMIFAGNTEEEVLYYLITEINGMFQRQRPLSDFVVTKAVGDIGDFEPEYFKNEKGQERVKIGVYSVKPFPSSVEEQEKLLIKNNLTDEIDYYRSQLPPQVQLAEKMRSRGERVDKGTRLEYVVTDPKNHNAKQSKKVEEYEYMKRHANVIELDYYYYLDSLSKPIDQMLNAAFGKNTNFVLNQYNLRTKHHKIILEKIKLFGLSNITLYE